MPGGEKVLKSLSDTRWEEHTVAIEAILSSYPQIIEALEYLQEDISQKGTPEEKQTTLQMKCEN